MNKYLFIGITLLVITLVIGFWVYLLFNGAPSSTSSLFSDFSFTTENSPERPSLQQPLAETAVDTSSQTLNQLTTRPVAGFQAVIATSSSHIIYAEKGTGHIFKINLLTGQEERISNTTHNRVVEAHFSKNADKALLITENGYQQESHLIDMSGSSTSTLPQLPNNTGDHYFIENSLFYTVVENGQTAGYSIDLLNGAKELIFTSPLTDTDTIWSTEGIFIVNRPAQKLRGGLYEVTGGGYRRVSGPDYGFTAFKEGSSGWIISKIDTQEQKYQSYYLNNQTGTETLLAITAIPDKCAIDNTTNSTWCVAPYLETTPTNYLSEWYQGKVMGEDYIWQIDHQSGDASLVFEPTEQTGFPIDAIKVSLTESNLFFINRLNDTLWRYEVQ